MAGGERIAAGRQFLDQLINADPDEIVVGASTTSNVCTLFQALWRIMQAGEEIIVTNQDHEASNDAWRALEATGIGIREWRMHADTEDLEIEDLLALLNQRMPNFVPEGEEK